MTAGIMLFMYKEHTIAKNRNTAIIKLKLIVSIIFTDLFGLIFGVLSWVLNLILSPPLANYTTKRK